MPKASLKIERTEPIPGVILIAATGAILLGTESQCIVDLVREGLSIGKKTFLFDLTAVTKIDSTGIGRFISAYNTILKEQGELRLICGPGLVLKSFQVTRLDSVFQIFPALGDALGNLSK